MPHADARLRRTVRRRRLVIRIEADTTRGELAQQKGLSQGTVGSA